MMGIHSGLVFCLPAGARTRGMYRVKKHSAAPPPQEKALSEPPPPSEEEEIATPFFEHTPFEDCEKYHSQGGCKPVLHQRYDGNRGDIFRCTTCGRTFSSRRGGILFKSRLSDEVVAELMDRHHKGESIRRTARALSLNRGTVRRYFRLLDAGVQWK